MYFYRNLKYPSECILDDMEYCIFFSLTLFHKKYSSNLVEKIVLNLEK